MDLENGVSDVEGKEVPSQQKENGARYMPGANKNHNDLSFFVCYGWVKVSAVDHWRNIGCF